MKKILIIAIVLISSTTYAQQADPRYIEVTGSAETEVTPDIIILAVELREYNEKGKKVFIETIENEFMAAVQKSSVDKSQVSISSVNIDGLLRRRARKLSSIETQSYAEKSFEVKFSKTADAVNFLSNLEDLKYVTVGIARLDHTEMSKLRLDTRVAAIKAAQHNASAMAEAIGAKLGRPLRVDEGESDEGVRQFIYASNSPYASNVAYTSAKASDGSVGVEIAKIPVKFVVRTKFELE